jgi:hypothetical protein
LTLYEIPLSASPQRFTIPLPIQGTPNTAASYSLLFLYQDAPPTMAGGGSWTIDITDPTGALIMAGIPLVLGSDLLGQFDYLNLGGHLALTSETGAVPTFFELGTSGRLYWVTVP